MTTRGALDWTQALLLTAFDDLLCRVAAMTFGVDSLGVPLSQASPKIKFDLPDTASFRALYSKARSSRNKAARKAEMNTAFRAENERYPRLSACKIEGVRLIQDWSVRGGASRQNEI
ncbi:hypothetical protein DB88DRAFT_132135 [Papiliotrema laurentii]|uniref:Uncharacterized protein n=1 Tax=Papiliotrema laurentii TaxID=5418 RepID=A0AAD9CTS4_PAPLA|nr:hypothetical protein DB88DRAFT_132135 [Papiliotrema laurentii]